MTDEPLQDPDWLRIEQHFPDEADLTLQVLKGHLIIEEQLRLLLDRLLFYPDALRGKQGTSFDCHQIICLVQATTKYTHEEPWIWPAAKRLNNIRNSLAHNLAPASIDQKIQSLITFVTQENPTIRRVLERNPTPAGYEFKAVILAMSGALNALRQLIEADASKA